MAARRPYVRAHEPMLLEYLTKNYPAGSWRTNVRLGRPHEDMEALIRTDAQARAMTTILHCADAVVFLKDEIHIIEVETEAKVHKTAQLKLYGHLFHVTEAYREHWGKETVLIIVSPTTSDLIKWFTNLEGILWIEYRPIWWESHIAGKRKRTYTPPAVRVPEGGPQS